MGEPLDDTACRLLFKVILVGDAGVGKTSLLRWYVRREYADDTDSTIGVDFNVRKLIVRVADPSLAALLGEDAPVVKLQVWDTAGHERFRTITSAYMRGAAGCLLVHDLGRPGSLASLASWLERVRDASPDVVPVVVAAKGDAPAEGAQLADPNPNLKAIPSYTTSAKCGEGVDMAFAAVAHHILHGPAMRALNADGRIAGAHRRSVVLCEGVTLYPRGDDPLAPNDETKRCPSCAVC